ncbi:MAG: 23S rRNA (adenine(2503)-C(2))-methyltransferase RlmN [Deltaproteobacteria bacterium]|jgi:23S rRNA (adenine2503-C2)-methyltransferase|nr:23S rRNA (adenine(2503)-C(2))-methyltransferase RlmN [Deltaproteobacteria bacterium]
MTPGSAAAGATVRARLLDLSPEELSGLCVTLGEKPYRGRQLAAWLFRKGAMGFSEMTDVSVKCRSMLADSAEIAPAPLAEAVDLSPDGAEKTLWRLHDGLGTESVIIPDGDRRTLCVSSQAGCAVGCLFCRTGAMGFRRNLTQGEIIFPALAARRLPGEAAVTNLVFMGMGEPFHNAENVRRALRILNDPEYAAFPRRQTTISTIGVTPALGKLTAQDLKNSLAISLNTPFQDERDRLMPGARAYPLEGLREAIRDLPLRRGRRITLAYVLLGGVNDTPRHAEALAGWCEGLRVKVNLIPFNPWPGARFRRPDEGAAEAFRETLVARNLTALTRKSYGRDVSAACGQLAGRSETFPADAGT